jgi:hypothetical protein
MKGAGAAGALARMRGTGAHSLRAAWWRCSCCWRWPPRGGVPVRHAARAAGGWQGWARPLVADYVDRLAAEIGSPPDAGVPRAGAAPADHACASTGRRCSTTRTRAATYDDGGPARRDAAMARSALERRTADGHRLRFGLALLPDPNGRAGWAGFTLAALLLLTARPTPWCAGCCGRWGHRRRRARFGRGDFARPSCAAARRAGRAGRAHQRHGRAACTACWKTSGAAAGHQPRTAQPADARAAERRTGGRRAAKDALLRDLAEMRDLISSLLESERLAAGAAALQPEPVDLNALVREMAGQLPTAPDLQMACRRCRADTTRLKLLLRNLIDNALRHGGDAVPPPQVFLRREADGRLALGVRDHGPGVADEQLPRLAQAFYRPDSARTRRAGGVGLGLYLCRLVAQAHGGELRIRNAAPGLEVAMVWAPLPAVAAG